MMMDHPKIENTEIPLMLQNPSMLFCLQPSRVNLFRHLFGMTMRFGTRKS